MGNSKFQQKEVGKLSFSKWSNFIYNNVRFKTAVIFNARSIDVETFIHSATVSKTSIVTENKDNTCFLSDIINMNMTHYPVKLEPSFPLYENPAWYILLTEVRGHLSQKARLFYEE